jgi:hypothetical protein
MFLYSGRAEAVDEQIHREGMSEMIVVMVVISAQNNFLKPSHFNVGIII